MSQFDIDEFIEVYQKLFKHTVFQGTPITEMGREQLMALVVHLSYTTRITLTHNQNSINGLFNLIPLVGDDSND